MFKDEQERIKDLLLQAHERGVELAIETSIRTGVPLVIEKEGKIFEIEPKYRYVRVPIKPRKSNPLKKSTKKIKDL